MSCWFGVDPSGKGEQSRVDWRLKIMSLKQALREYLSIDVNVMRPVGFLQKEASQNLASVGFAFLREQSSLVMPAEHLFYFTPRSPRRLIQATPLNIVAFQPRGMDIPDVYSYVRDIERSQPVADFLSKRASILQAVIDSAGCANHMRFVVGL